MDSGRCIVFTQVSKSFGSKTVLQNLSFTVQEGDRYAIIGKSGAGKSVCLKLILGLTEPDEGSVSVFGEQVSSSPEALRNIRLKSSMVFQGSALFDSLSLAENVAFPLIENGTAKPAEAMDKAAEMLRKVDLEDAFFKYPSELSGGMRRRAAFARAVVTEPDLILFDEPTTGLDPLTSAMVDDLMLQLCQQISCTAVIVTHDMRSAKKVSDKIAFLEDGQFRWAGPTKEIFESEDRVIKNFISGGISDEA